MGLEAALDGARAAYHLAPNMHPDEVGIAAGWRAAAVGERALPRLVFHSVLHPDDARMPHHLRKAEAEAVLRAALGERVTVLRPAAYHQNLVGPGAPGMLPVPYSLDAPFTNVDLEDVAEVAVDAPARGSRGADPRPRRARGALGPRSWPRRDGRARPPRPARPLDVAEWVAGPGAPWRRQAPRTTSWRCSRRTTGRPRRRPVDAASPARARAGDVGAGAGSPLTSSRGAAPQSTSRSSMVWRTVLVGVVEPFGRSSRVMMRLCRVPLPRAR